MRLQRALGQLLRSLAFTVAVPSVCFAQEGAHTSAVIQLKDGKMSFTSSQAVGDTASGIFVVDPGATKFDLTILDQFGCGSLVVVDEAGRIVTTGVRNDNSYQIKLTNRGYYEIRCIRKGSASTESILSRSIALIRPAIQKGRLGVMGTPDDGKFLNTLSVQWGRDFIFLHNYGMTAGAANFVAPSVSAQFNWCDQDHECLRVMMPTPKWLRPEHSGGETLDAMYPPIDMERFKKLVKFAIGSYSHPIHYLEALNEPDIWWKGSDDELIQYYKAVSEAARKINPGIKLLGPSYATFKIQRLKRLIDLGLLNYIDGISMHAYGRGAPEDYMSDSLDQLELLLSAAGKPNFPIYITEFGWGTAPGQKQVSALGQAQNDTRGAMLLLSRANINAVLAFTLYHYGEKKNTAGYSMLNQDLSPKPVFVAFAQLAWRLASVAPSSISLRRTKDGIYLLSGKGGDGNMVIAWHPGGPIKSATPCLPKKVEDMMGRTLPYSDTATVTLDASPLYFVGCQR